METALAMTAIRDAYLKNCPCREVLDLLANKWSALVIGLLADGPARFAELRRRVGGINQKVLTQTLRALERNGLITRTVYPTTPPQVSYALTDLGFDVAHHLIALRAWSEKHLEEIEAARTRYDARRLGAEPPTARILDADTPYGGRPRPRSI